MRMRRTNWYSVRGKIVNSDTQERYNRAAENAVSSWSYAPIVEYEFEVNKEKYRSERVYAGYDFSSSEKNAAMAIVKKYPKGSQVEVHYDMNNPKNSCLEMKLHTGAYAFLFIGLLFCIMGIVMFIIRAELA